MSHSHQPEKHEWSTLTELIQRSQGLKDEAARLLEASRDLDTQIKAALEAPSKAAAQHTPHAPAPGA